MDARRLKRCNRSRLRTALLTWRSWLGVRWASNLDFLSPAGLTAHDQPARGLSRIEARPELGRQNLAGRSGERWPSRPTSLAARTLDEMPQEACEVVGFWFAQPAQ